MKIGILTQALEINYGGILQNFALQSVLKSMGHEVITIRRCHNESKCIIACKFIGRIYWKFIKGMNIDLFSRYPTKRNNANIRIQTEPFIKKHISITERLSFGITFLKYVNKQNFDAYIVGSDQVWRPIYSPSIMTYFFDFLEKKSNVKRISYAASFGTDDWEFTEKQTARASELIKMFDMVSVRELSAINICKKRLHRDDVQFVLDPTMLLDKADYIQIVEKSKTPKSEGNLMTYILDKSDEKNAIIKKVAASKGLKPFSVKAKADYLEKNTLFEDCIQPPVEKWLRGFIDADYVIADSFHGCVFAIIFNKPFFAIGNKVRGIARFDSLFKVFGLEDRIVYGLSDVTSEKINSPIDWGIVNVRHEDLKTLSIEFLKKALN